MAEYTAARAVPGFDILTLCYKGPKTGRLRRLVWHGKNGYVLRDGVEIWH